MKSAYLIAGMRLSRFIKLLMKNGMSLFPKYLLRFLFLLQNGIWASVFYRKEKSIYQNILVKHKLRKDPVIIIGHWRTGSTFLHQLMAKDLNLVTTSVFQGSIPDSFLSSRKSYEPVMRRALKGTRPMDAVKLGMDEPLEDEYALFRLCGYSPLERLVFPKKNGYFLNNYPGFLPGDNKLEEWKSSLITFYKKLTLENNKIILIKNPFHSFRIKILNEIFPEAKFVHIYRHPYKVVPSTIRMWDIVGKQNSMNKKWQKPTNKEVSSLLLKMMNQIKTDFSNLPVNRLYELKFEDLEKDPVSEIKSLYNYFNLDFSEVYHKQLSDFLVSVKGYQKNKYRISGADKLDINVIMKDWMLDKNYNLD